MMTYLLEIKLTPKSKPKYYNLNYCNNIFKLIKFTGDVPSNN